LAGRTIYLVRHGETEWNRVGRWQGITDIALSDTGRAQARALVDRLHARGLVRVFASDLARARETAEIIAAAHGLAAPVCDARLRERGFGCFEGLTREECAAQFPEAWERYHRDRRWTPPGAEIHEDVVKRVLKAMLDIAHTLRDQQAALVVSHGGTMRSFANAITGTQPPPIANADILRVRYIRGRFTDVDLLTAADASGGHLAAPSARSV
jgi:probable phosphoglycerate mutase